MSPGSSRLPSLVDAVREFVERDVRPTASALEHADRYPRDLVERMARMGLFGALVPAQYGGLGLDVSTYARIIEELCRGFMSLAGVINSHTMAALIVYHHGTEEQRLRLLPRFASGQARGGLCLTEPHAGSDVQAIRTVARRDGDRYLLSGSKMFVTNGREGNTFALLALTEPDARPRHRGMSCFIVEKGAPGLEVVKSIAKLGYKGVDTAELVFDGFPCPAANLVGGVEGRGFKHVMSGLETGRINIAARAVGVAQAGLDEAVRVARALPEPPAALADIATRVESARLVTYWAAAMKDRGDRCDLEAGMAKLHASEAAQEVAVETMRHRGSARPARLRAGRATLSRRSAHDHRRGHQRDPAAHHLPEPAGAVRRAPRGPHQPGRSPRRAAAAGPGGAAGGGEGRGAGDPRLRRGAPGPRAARRAARRARPLRRPRRARARGPRSLARHHGHDRGGGGAVARRPWAAGSAPSSRPASPSRATRPATSASGCFRR